MVNINKFVIRHSYTYRLNSLLTISSLKERPYTETMRRNCWIPAVPTDVSALPSVCIHWLSIKVSLGSQQTTTERVHTFPKKSQMTEPRKERQMSSD
jgi:hypothetical protein